MFNEFKFLENRYPQHSILVNVLQRGVQQISEELDMPPLSYFISHYQYFILEVSGNNVTYSHIDRFLEDLSPRRRIKSVVHIHIY